MQHRMQQAKHATLHGRPRGQSRTPKATGKYHYAIDYTTSPLKPKNELYPK